MKPFEEIKIRGHCDERGSLGFFEDESDLGFVIRRIYYLYNINADSERGAHAHKALHQCIVAVSGSVIMSLDDGQKTSKITLDRPDKGVLIRPGLWRDLYSFSQDAVILVAASLPYDEADYIRDYDDFLSYVRSK